MYEAPIPSWQIKASNNIILKELQYFNKRGLSFGYFMLAGKGVIKRILLKISKL